MSGGSVDPIEFVGQSQELELFEREVKLPSVRNKVEKIRRRSNRPVVNQVLANTKSCSYIQDKKNMGHELWPSKAFLKQN